MQPHLRKCGIVPDQHSVVGSKVLLNFYATCVYNLCRVFKTDISAVLTVKSGLDPHMIIELEE